MIFHPTPIEGLLVVEFEPRSDERGSMRRVYAAEELAAVGIEHPVIHGNVTRTTRAGTVRGMHYQAPPSAEGKFVRVTQGALFDVGVDVRQGSPTFGQHWAMELTESDDLAVILPRGVAHGSQTLKDDTEVTYLMSAGYDVERERGLRFDDPALAIEWPLPVVAISEKDRRWPDLGPRAAVCVDH